MMVRASMAAAALLALCSGTLSSAQDAPAPTPAPAKEKKICQRVLPTGSIMPHTICQTKAEWAAQAPRNQAGADRLRDSAAIRGEGQLNR